VMLENGRSGRAWVLSRFELREHGKHPCQSRR
jgi:hypothetical protein